MKTTGDVLRLLRQQRCWTQEAVAHELNMSLPGYAKIERNLTDITLSRLIQLSKLFGLTASELLALCEKPSDAQLEKVLEEKDQEIMRLQQRIIELMEKGSKGD